MQGKYPASKFESREIETIEDRLEQLEDIARELNIILSANFLMHDKAKQGLLMQGQHFDYQQGALDLAEVIVKVLEGKTNFHELTEVVRAEAEKSRAEVPEEMDFV